MADWNGKSKAWRRGAEILKKKFNVEADTSWDLPKLQERLKSEGEKAAKEAASTPAPAAATTTTVTPTKAEVVQLPANQKVDVQAPIMNVHVPAPHVSVHSNFSWLSLCSGAWTWGQAFALGFSTAFLLPAFIAWLGA